MGLDVKQKNMLSSIAVRHLHAAAFMLSSEWELVLTDVAQGTLDERGCWQPSGNM